MMATAIKQHRRSSLITGSQRSDRVIRAGAGGAGRCRSGYAASVGGAIVAPYREVESGKNNQRPELAKAIAHAKRIKGTLVIAKLDRLARNVAFVANLMESDVDFIACDNATANRLTIHILAAVAEDEARRISERTKLLCKPPRHAGRSWVRVGRVIGPERPNNIGRPLRSLATLLPRPMPTPLSRSTRKSDPSQLP